MELRTHYDPEIEAVSLRYGQPTCGGYEVAENWSIILHALDDDVRNASKRLAAVIAATSPVLTASSG